MGWLLGLVVGVSVRDGAWLVLLVGGPDVALGVDGGGGSVVSELFVPVIGAGVGTSVSFVCVASLGAKVWLPSEVVLVSFKGGCVGKAGIFAGQPHRGATAAIMNEQIGLSMGKNRIATSCTSWHVTLAFPI